MKKEIVLELQSNRYYLTKQTLLLRKRSLASAAILYAYFCAMDLVRFTPDIYQVTLPIRIVFFLIPLIALSVLYWKKDEDNQEIHLFWLTYLYLAAGFIHCFLLYFLDKYETFFTNTGFILIIMYGCLLTAIPIKVASVASVILMITLVFSMSLGAYPTQDVTLNAVVYSFFIILCLFISRMCQMILIENFSLIKRLYNESVYDGMTQLFNRRHFDQQLNLLMQIAKRDNRNIGLVFLDVDKFKQFNDLQGHLAADDVLKLISAALQKICRREGDFAARYGGDEFVLVFYDINKESLNEKCSSILQAIKSLNVKHPNSPISSFVTVSVGATLVHPIENNSCERSIKQADENLYVAKEKGRNGFHLTELQ